MRPEGRRDRHRSESISALMIDFVIVHMDIFHMMSFQLAKNEPGSLERESASGPSRRSLQKSGLEKEQQPEQQQQQPSPLKRLLRLRKLARFYNKLFLYFYLVELVRYVLIDLLTLDTFQDYQLLDCFILGRFRFIGRTNKISSRIVFVFMGLFALWRLLVFNVFIPPFKFYCLEFLMYDHKRVVLEEMKFRSRASRLGHTESVSSIKEPDALKARHHLDLPHNAHLNPVFYVKSPFNLTAEPTAIEPRLVNHNDWILRPNRTSRCWRLLEVYTQCAIYGSIAALVVWISLIYRTIGGAIVTDLGFELSYISCTSWLQRQQLAANASAPLARLNSTSLASKPYEWIYTAPAVLASQLKVDDIPAIIPLSLAKLSILNAYHTSRIVLDICINNCWYIEFMFTASCVTYLIIMSSMDVILNASEIHRRLGAIVDKMTQLHDTRRVTCDFIVKLHGLGQQQQQQQQRRAAGRRQAKVRGQPAGGRRAHNTAEQREKEELSDEVATIQAVLADHFDLVRGYNHFVSFALTLILAVWCLYSLVISIWMGSVRSTAVEFEFLVTEIGSTLFAVFFFSGAAIARSLNYRLYALIARATALDDNQTATKLRWANIMKLYSPRPKYCFTLLGFAEISSLFCLQFVWWIVSAYIVLAKFFYTNPGHSY